MSTDVVEYTVVVTGETTVDIVSVGVQGPSGPSTVTLTVGFGIAVDRPMAGLTDYATLNTAITDVSNGGGGTVLLRLAALPYSFAADIQLKSNVKLIAEAGVKLNLQTGYGVVVGINVSNATIEGFEFNATAHTTTNKVVALNSGSSDVLIRNNRLLNIKGFGIFSDASSTDVTQRLTITGNRFEGLGGNDLIGGGPLNSTGAVVRDLIVTDNYINQDATQGVHYTNAIDVVAAYRLKFANNNVAGGVIFGSEQWPHRESIITGNTIKNPGVGYVAQVGFLLNATLPGAAESHNLTISNNTIEGGYLTITNSTTNSTCRGVVVMGNVVDATGCTNGLSVSRITDGVFIGNTIRNATSDAVNIFGGGHNVLSGNIIRNNGGVGINMDATTDTNNIFGNDLSNNFGPINLNGFNNTFYNNAGANPIKKFNVGNVSGTKTINPTDGNYQTLSVTADTVLTINAPKAPGDMLTLRITNTTFNLTWPSNVTFRSGTPPTINGTYTLVLTWDTNYEELARSQNAATNPTNDQDVATKSYVDLDGRLPAHDLKYGIQLSGSNGSNVDLAVKTYLDGAKPFTVGMWVDFGRKDLADDGALFSYGYDNTTDKGYSIRLNNTDRRPVIFCGASTNQATANNLYCYGPMWVTFTFDGVSTFKAYKNGVLTDTLTIASAARNAHATIHSFLGTRDATARNLSGIIDDAFLYARVLAPAEMTSIFRDAVFPSGALFIYHFDERTGTTATDSSGSGNNGTINSGTYIVSPHGNPNRLSPLPTTAQAAAANANTIKTGLLIIGSSTTAGTGSSSLDNRYTDQLGALMHKEFNDPAVVGGKHIRAADGTWTAGGTGTPTLNGDGLGLGSWSLPAGSNISVVLTNCTGFDIHFVQGPGQGTFTYQVDGGSAVTVTPSTSGATNRHDGTFPVTGLALGSHTVKINATNACIINGYYVHNGDATTGYRVYNSGKGSTASADFVTAAADTIWTRAATLNIHCVLIMLSSNDFSGSIDPATFKSQVYTIIRKAWVALAATNPDILLVNSYKRSDQVGYGTVYTYDKYGPKLKELANELEGVYYADISSFFPLVNDSVHDTLSLLNSDNIHPDPNGHTLIARLVRRKLVPSVF